MNFLYSKKIEKQTIDLNYNIYKKITNDVIQLNNLIKILEDSYAFYNYGITFGDIKYTIRNKYKDLVNIENLNMKYLAMCIFILYTEEFTTDYFKSNHWNSVFENLDLDKSQESNIQKEIYIYMIYIKNEDNFKSV